MKRIQIVVRSCPRCGRPVAGTSRSLYGADEAHAKYAGLCERCCTDAERDDMAKAQAAAILDGGGR